MSKKLLLYVDRNPMQQYGYNQMTQNVLQNELGGNSGNSIFQFALNKELELMDVTLDTMIFNRKKCSEISDDYFEYINDVFSSIIFCPANLISQYAITDGTLERFTGTLKKIKIPVHLVGLGAQSDNLYSMDFLEHNIKYYENFLKEISDKGGQIGVRGYFTAECLEKMGLCNNQFDIIGCPSMYLKGEKLKIDRKPVNIDNFQVAINGFRAWNDYKFHEWMRKYNAVFICQDEFYKLLYEPSKLTWKEYQYLEDDEWITFYLNNKIKLYGDFSSWYYSIKKYDFSFGCRVHGNIAAILSGVPAYIDEFDSRSREIAEFFDIPGEIFYGDFPDPYELYLKADYSKFNNNITTKYIKFQKFMHKCGIDSLKVTEDNEIPKWSEPLIIEKNRKQIIEQKENVRLQKEGENYMKIVFVAHEFGLFKGNGGIASYLYQTTKFILENYKNIQIDIITIDYDDKCELIKNKRFSIHKICPGSLQKMGNLVLQYLKKIKPQYVECADYLGLCLESIEYKIEYGKELADTKFIIDNHTASKECFEWSSKLPIKLAPVNVKEAYKREYAQMVLADANISPSNFLSKYIEKNYGIQKVYTVRHPVNFEERPQSQLKQFKDKTIDFNGIENNFVVSCISRFEGRKNQEYLIREFIYFLQKTNAKACLVLAGNSSRDLISNKDERLRLYEMIPEEYRDKIKFFDYVQKREKQNICSVTNVAVMASTFENYPVSMTEYVYDGIPIIASKYSGCYDFMKDSQEYTVFDPFVQNSLGEVLCKFYELNEIEQKACAQKQLNLLKKLSRVDIAIQKKLHFFADIKRNSVSQERNIFYISEKESDNVCDYTGCADIVLYKKRMYFQTKSCCDFKIYGKYINELDERFVVSFCNDLQGNIIDALCQDAIIFYPKVKMNRGKEWYKILALETLVREKKYINIPTLQEINTERENVYKNIIDEIFLDRNVVNMEELYYE